MNNFIKKFLCILIALTMCLGMVSTPITAYAKETTSGAVNEGVEENQSWYSVEARDLTGEEPTTDLVSDEDKVDNGIANINAGIAPDDVAVISNGDVNTIDGVGPNIEGDTYDPDWNEDDDRYVQWYAYKVFNLVNQQRMMAGVPVLQYDGYLQSFCDTRAKEIIESFQHVRPNGELVINMDSNRINGENIGRYSSSPEAMMEAWMNSEGHKENILDPDYKSMAVACYYVLEDANNYHYYWVQIFSDDPASQRFLAEDKTYPISDCPHEDYDTIQGWDPTCEDDGSITYYVCNTCYQASRNPEFTDLLDEFLNDAVIPAKGHQYEEHPAVEATCDSDGNIRYWTCSQCDGVFSDIEEINGTHITMEDTVIEGGHKLIEHPAKEPTCAFDGYETYWRCSRCGKMFSDDAGENEIRMPVAIESEGHDLVDHEGKEATCTEDGQKAYQMCQTCGKYFVDGVEVQPDELVIKATGHDMNLQPPMKASCEQNGQESYWYCRNCKQMFRDEAGNEKITYNDVVILAHHDLAIVMAKDATCTEDGNIQYYKCNVCGKIFKNADDDTPVEESEVVIPAEHKNVDYVEKKDATETEVGNIEYWHCTVCDKYFTNAELTNEVSVDKIEIPVLGSSTSEESSESSEEQSSETESSEIESSETESSETESSESTSESVSSETSSEIDSSEESSEEQSSEVSSESQSTESVSSETESSETSSEVDSSETSSESSEVSSESQSSESSSETQSTEVSSDSQSSESTSEIQSLTTQSTETQSSSTQTVVNTTQISTTDSNVTASQSVVANTVDEMVLTGEALRYNGFVFLFAGVAVIGVVALVVVIAKKKNKKDNNN